VILIDHIPVRSSPLTSARSFSASRFPALPIVP